MSEILSLLEIQPFSTWTWALFGLMLALAGCFFTLAAWTYIKLDLCPSEVDVSAGYIALRTAASISEPHGFDKIFITWSL